MTADPTRPAPEGDPREYLNPEEMQQLRAAGEAARVSGLPRTVTVRGSDYHIPVPGDPWKASQKDGWDIADAICVQIGRAVVFIVVFLVLVGAVSFAIHGELPAWT